MTESVSEEVVQNAGKEGESVADTDNASGVSKTTVEDNEGKSNGEVEAEEGTTKTDNDESMVVEKSEVAEEEIAIENDAESIVDETETTGTAENESVENKVSKESDSIEKEGSDQDKDEATLESQVVERVPVEKEADEIMEETTMEEAGENETTTDKVAGEEDTGKSETESEEVVVEISAAEEETGENGKEADKAAIENATLKEETGNSGTEANEIVEEKEKLDDPQKEITQEGTAIAEEENINEEEVKESDKVEAENSEQDKAESTTESKTLLNEPEEKEADGVVEETATVQEENADKDEEVVEKTKDNDGEAESSTVNNKEILSSPGGEVKPYPAPFQPIDSEKRSSSHQKLRSYESRRRAAYGSKLSSSSLYWRSFRELVKKSLLETKHAERMVLSRVLASETFATHMQAIHDDLVDDVGKPITDPKKKKKIATKREKERKNMSSDNANSGDDQKSSFTLGESNGEPDDKHGSLLKPLVECHAVLASRYNETTKVLREKVTDELTNLREQLQDKIMTMEALGDAILEELEAAEDEVMEAWEKYYVESGKHDDTENDKIAAKRVGAAFNDTEVNPQKNCVDTWIYEMQYRMAVAYLSSCWEKCSAELSRLFTSLKATEVSRRHRLRELLVTFLEKEENLWVSLPATMTSVLKGIVDRPTDRNLIEENVQNSIKVRAQAIQREEQVQRSKEAVGPGLSSYLAKEGNFELSSPLLSNFMLMAKIVEKKDAGMMKSWKTVLAVVTADSFLHLFDVPSHLQLQTGSAVEVAFHALVPPVEIPTMNNVKTGFAPKAWNQFLTPTDTLVLPNSRIVFDDDGKNTAFEMHETVFNKGAKTVFGKTTVKKIFFRTRTYEETEEWLGALIANKMSI